MEKISLSPTPRPLAHWVNNKLFPFLFLVNFLVPVNLALAQAKKPELRYILSIPKPTSHAFHVDLHVKGFSQDSLNLKMPRWTPGYYQIMDYAKAVEHVSVKNSDGKEIPFKKINENTWLLTGIRNKSLLVSYDVQTSRPFVASSYVDSTRAYIVPAGAFFYADGFLNLPVSLQIKRNQESQTIATGLEKMKGKPDEYLAPDFDTFYDCPILIGNLEELPPFKVNGIEHRFIGHNMGTFDKVDFMIRLKKIVEAAAALIGHIPYKQYTFIAIGPGRGGIEHLNNTTFSFSGNGLNTAEGMNRMMNFLAHEYFHHYNVKRIRPFELGPFDYDQGSRTNLLWVSEGLSVYYEYLVVKRAGLVDEKTLFTNLETNVNATENNPGRAFQSLAQASYSTWKDGPFGNSGGETGKSISYYDKGPVVGMLLDFAIRHASQNQKALDDVMRLLYWKYYWKEKRGFTDAEFRQACETVAGASLNAPFDYVYTTKELDYTTYLGYAGLKLKEESVVAADKTTKRKLSISRLDNPDALQQSILKSWLGE